MSAIFLQHMNSSWWKLVFNCRSNNLFHPIYLFLMVVICLSIFYVQSVDAGYLAHKLTDRRKTKVSCVGRTLQPHATGHFMEKQPPLIVFPFSFRAGLTEGCLDQFWSMTIYKRNTIVIILLTSIYAQYISLHVFQTLGPIDNKKARLAPGKRGHSTQRDHVENG